MDQYTDAQQKQIISDNLTQLIAQKGKDQKQIALELDINYQTFNQWVKGMNIPPVSKIQKMANYFNVTLIDIVDPPDAPSRTNAKLVKLTNNELKLLQAYSKADGLVQDCVRKLLDIN